VKIRTSFVSNSSSSSFVVAFPYKLKSARDVKKILFGNQKYFVHSDMERLSYTTASVAKRVWQDIQNQKSKVGTKYMKDIYIHYCKPKQWTVIDHIRKGYAECNGNRTIADFICLLNEPYLYHFCYGDEISEFEGLLEHGKIFNNVKYFRFR
jgi:hypothetical protein